jgi:hypothetical protein
MAIPQTIRHDGALTGNQSPGGIPGALELLPTALQATYAMAKTAAPSIINATSLSPYVIPLETISRIRLFGMRVRGQSIKVLVTSAAGADQAFNVSDLLLLHCPNQGDELTAIKLVGTADITYVIAGDVG